MNGRQRDDVVRLLAGYTAELLQTRFSAIGSLYPDGTDAQESTLGPMIPTCNPWCFRADATLDSGPWVTEIEYLVECIARELQWISSHQADLNSKWESENLGDRYKSLFTKLQKRIDTIECLNPGSGSFVLRHPDLDPANIMVVVDEDSEDDNSTVTVTSVLDWECANTAPIWAVAQIPEFLADRGEESGETVDERRSKAELRGLFSRSIPESFGVGSRKAQSLVALEEAAQTITTMRSVADLDRIVSDVFADLAAAGL
ncbi:hypothetical protein C8R43DRAFT_1177445 [Mycena crocata]|nr:hypothetical protein C8R43DRAFT_1177445 [Mycena crocata]